MKFSIEFMDLRNHCYSVIKTVPKTVINPNGKSIKNLPYSIAGYCLQQVRYKSAITVENREIGINNFDYPAFSQLLKALKRKTAIKALEQFELLRIKLEKLLNARVLVKISFNTTDKASVYQSLREDD